MSEAFSILPTDGAITAFFQVVLIDLVLAGDNAVAVGLLAANLPRDQRRRAIFFGLAGAVVLLIGFALIATQLLKVTGLRLVGGCLLLLVCWKMWRELRDPGTERRNLITANSDRVTSIPASATSAAAHRVKTLSQAMVQILVADLTMSIDNVLGVAGAARQHPTVLVAGLCLSITLMGVAASSIGKLLHRFPWIGYGGLAIVTYVALQMIWEGTFEVIPHLLSRLPAANSTP